MTNPESIKARLKNQAIEKGHLFQTELTTYALERTIYRISISDYVEKFTLKGGIFLYALFDGNFTRATSDIDLLAYKISNEMQDMRKIFGKIFSIVVDDALHYDLDSLNVVSITEFKKYHGVNVSIFSYLGNTKIRVSIDIGFGDVVYPDRLLIDFPVLLEMEAPRIYAYSLSSVIAEKFEAIVSIGPANSRYKDFYDIYIIAAKYDFHGDELKSAILETFNHRGTVFDEIIAFENDFALDKLRNTRWKSFINKKKALEVIEFPEVMEFIKRFLIPVVSSIQNLENLNKDWNSDEKRWQ